jgi:hypothetical protein
MGLVTGDPSQVTVDVVEVDAASEHEHLEVVEELGDLLGGAVLALVFGRHPDLRRFLDDLLADRVDAGIQGRDGARALGARPGLVGELGEQLIEGLHGNDVQGGRGSGSGEAYVSTADGPR